MQNDELNSAGSPDPPRPNRTLWERILDPRHIAFWALLASIASVGGFGVAVIASMGDTAGPGPSTHASMDTATAPVRLAGQIDDIKLVPGRPFKLTVRIRLWGFNGRTCVVRYTMYDLDTYRPLHGADDVAVITAVPESDDDQAAGTFDIAMPGFSGHFGTRVRLLDPKGVELAASEGPAITID